MAAGRVQPALRGTRRWQLRDRLLHFRHRHPRRAHQCEEPPAAIDLALLNPGLKHLAADFQREHDALRARITAEKLALHKARVLAEAEAAGRSQGACCP